MITPEERLRLFEQHRPWSVKLARKYAAKKGYTHFDADVLDGYAMTGLWDALKRWDKTKNPNVLGFVHKRIMGSIQDYVRNADEIGRCMRRRLGPSAPTIYMQSLLVHTDGRERIQESMTKSHENAVDLADLAERVLGVVPKRLQWILREYYWQHLELQDIAKARGITVSRASQILSEAMIAARKYVKIAKIEVEEIS